MPSEFAEGKFVPTQAPNPFSTVRRHCAPVLCHIMLRFTACLFSTFILFASTFHCGKKAPDAPAQATTGSDALPPKGSEKDAPDFVRSLSLLYPQAELYRVDNRLIQKTNHRLGDIVSYFEKTLGKHGFRQIAKLEQAGGALLQYERRTKGGGATVQICRDPDTSCVMGETISIDVNKLPYAENLLIRIGRSEVDYSKGAESKPKSD